MIAPRCCKQAAMYFFCYYLYAMLTPDEENFIKYWEQSKKNPTGLFGQFRFGFIIGSVIGIGILLSLATGWYSRANMVANSQFSPLVLIIAVIIIAVFCSFFNMNHRRDINEQRYKELMYKKEKLSGEVQHTDTNNSQSS